MKLWHEARDSIRGVVSVLNHRLASYFLDLILRRVVIGWFTDKSLERIAQAVKAVQEHRAKKEEKHGKDDVAHWDFTCGAGTRKRVPGGH